MINNSIIQFRSSRIGGSDVAAVLGKSKWGGAASVAQRILGHSSPQEFYKPEFEFGNRWEDNVAQLFAENHPEYLVITLQDAYQQNLLGKLIGFKGRVIELDDGSITVLHENHDFLVINTDYLLISRLGLGWGVLEIKTASEFAVEDWGLTGTDQVPSYYEDQPKHYTSSLGGDFCHLAVLIGQRDYREYPLPLYSEQEDTDVINSLCAWHQIHIVEGFPVAPSLGEEGLSVVYDELEASASLLEKIKAHKALNDNLKEIEKDLGKLDSEIRAESAEYSGITHDGITLFTHTEKATEKFDVNELKRKEPAVFAKYLKPYMAHRFAKATGYKSLSTITEADFGPMASDNKEVVA
jgi:predicted phage-related endonuclease